MTDDATGDAVNQLKRSETKENHRATRRWQRFLAAQGYECGPIDGWFGGKTEEATRQFQVAHGVSPTGEADASTLRTAETVAQAPFRPDAALFEIGPDNGGDLREHRPYFVVQLDRGGEALGQRAALFQAQQVRIANWLQQVVHQEGRLLLRPDDLTDAEGFALALKQAGSADLLVAGSPAAYLRALLSSDTVRRIDNLPDDLRQSGRGLPQPLRIALASELNRLIGETCLFARDRFPLPGTIEDLRRALGRLLGNDPRAAALVERLAGPSQGDDLRGRELLFVNRMLLKLAFDRHIPAPERRGNITDIYVLSHGWHRNFFRAVAAYDQIVSRLAILTYRRRLESPVPYHPLFLALHWNSDPAQDEWIDDAGRRNKASFFQNVEAVFERPTAEAERFVPKGERFSDLFEDVYQFFSQISAADTNALTDEALDARAAELGECLNRFSVCDAAGAEDFDKISVAWACYFRARAKGVLGDQEEVPARSITRSQAVWNLVRFVSGSVGILALVGLLLRTPFVRDALDALTRWVARLGASLGEWLHLPGAWGSSLGGAIAWILVIAAVLGAAALVGGGYLWAMARRSEERRRRRGVPLGHLVAWLPLQIVTTVPLLGHLFWTYFLGKRNRLVLRSVFDERVGERGKPIRGEDWSQVFKIDKKTGAGKVRSSSLRYRLSVIARAPIRLLRAALHPHNPGSSLALAVDNQLAFWEMQIRGTRAGAAAAEFLAELIARPDAAPLLKEARVHFLGHSFGGLVVLNALRHLVHDVDRESAPDTGPAARLATAPPTRGRRVSSVCLLQAAVASNWLEEERSLVEAVEGGIACIHSAYDTANSFYYPVANHGRLAAGYVGLFGTRRHEGKPAPALTLPRRDVETDRGMFASLVEPPDLRRTLYAVGETKPYVVNLDASRLIYEGPQPTGGGHGDIFKDDVIHLCWAVTLLGQPDRATAGAVRPVAVTEPRVGGGGDALVEAGASTEETH